jgi:hypothetical protein
VPMAPSASTGRLAKMSAKFGIHLPCYGTVGGEASGLGCFVILRESNQV